MLARIMLGLAVGLLLLGCSQPAPAPASSPASNEEVVSAPAGPTAVSQLPPTFTPRPAQLAPSPTSGPTLPPATPRPTNTPIDFDETAVEVRYQIPALGLDRRLQGNINSQLIYVDETSGAAFQRNNQASILLELQQVLPNLNLAEIPDGCDSCVRLSYALPLRGESASGWLQDPVLLASVENLMVVNLGPHWPPEAVAGLRRSASVYEPAHTIALAADGRLWSWLATADDVGQIETVDPDLLLAHPNWPPETAVAEYLVACPGVAIETFWWQTTLDETGQIRLNCPEFSLPFSLVPLYGQLSDWLEPALTSLGEDRRPPSRFPLDGWLLADWPNGDRLILFRDGRYQIQSAAGEIISDTLTLDLAAELVDDLLAADLVAPGLNTFLDEATPAANSVTLLIRTEDGVYDGRLPANRPELEALNGLLTDLLQLTEDEGPTTEE